MPHFNARSLSKRTPGIRELPVNRYTLDREIQQVETPYGNVRCKVSNGYDVTRRKYEFEDIARIAREHDLDLNWMNSRDGVSRPKF